MTKHILPGSVADCQMESFAFFLSSLLPVSSNRFITIVVASHAHPWRNPVMASINVALVGQGFMGRTHSNAWGQVAKFFKPPLTPVMHTVFGPVSYTHLRAHET